MKFQFFFLVFEEIRISLLYIIYLGLVCFWVIVFDYLWNWAHGIEIFYKIYTIQKDGKQITNVKFRMLMFSAWIQ
jgi:hypothetical protein